MGAGEDVSPSGAVSWFNVIVVADRYVFASWSCSGGIGYNGTPGGNGVPGAAGPTPVSCVRLRVGTAHRGAGGRPGSITIAVDTLDPVSLTAIGAAGGERGAGGVGGGAPGQERAATSTSRAAT